MKDLVSAVAVGKADDKIIADMDYREEHIEEFNPDSQGAPVADIPVAMIHNTREITLLQMDGEISKENLLKALQLAQKVLDQVYTVQKQALKARYATP